MYLPEELPECKTVLIDEGQFFRKGGDDAFRKTCTAYANAGINVYISALNGTSEQEPWETVSDIIPICDEIHHLKAKLCMRCRKRAAPFTGLKRGQTKNGQIKVGGSDEYEPVCRFCL
jgi:thymidine kinase